MSTWVIGDVQACFESLLRLLERCDFDETQDRLWFVGDLVNRGPHSAKTLKWIYQRRDICTTVLGNHDLHLLMRAAKVRGTKPRDTLEDVIDAPECDEWLDWLRHCPMLHVEDEFVLVHAGLLPTWSLSEAKRRARGIEQALQGDEYHNFLSALSAGESLKPEATWAEEIESAGIMTRMRMLDATGRPHFDYSGPPESGPEGYSAWFDFPHARKEGRRVLFGHWAALGYRADPGFVALDSGCVWGNCLTAFCLDDSRVVQQEYCE